MDIFILHLYRASPLELDQIGIGWRGSWMLHFRKSEKDKEKIELKLNLNPVFKFTNPKNFLASYKMYQA